MLDERIQAEERDDGNSDEQVARQPRPRYRVEERGMGEDSEHRKDQSRQEYEEGPGGHGADSRLNLYHLLHNRQPSKN